MSPPRMARFLPGYWTAALKLRDGFLLGGGSTVMQNTTIGKKGNGFHLTTSGFSLKNNASGGTGSGQPNTGCQYRSVGPNTNNGHNKSNNVVVPGAVGNPFPTGCKN